MGDFIRGQGGSYCINRSYISQDLKEINLEVITEKPLPNDFYNELQELVKKYATSGSESFGSENGVMIHGEYHSLDEFKRNS